MKQLFGLVSAFISALALGLTACGGSVDVREPIGSTSHVDDAAGDDAIGTTGSDTANTTSGTTTESTTSSTSSTTTTSTTESGTTAECAAESCNSVDDNCDGEIDEGCAFLHVSIHPDSTDNETVWPDINLQVMRAHFTTGSEQEPVKIEELCYKRLGVGSLSDFWDVFLCLESGCIFGDKPTNFDPVTQRLCFSGLDLTVQPGTATYVDLWVSWNEPMPGNQHKFQLEGMSVAGSVNVTGVPVTSGSYVVGSEHWFQLATDTFQLPSATIPLCTKSATLLSFYHSTWEKALKIEKERFEILSTDGGYVKGSLGTPYFTNIQLKNETTGATLMGPIELPAMLAPISSSTGVLTMSDTFDLLQDSEVKISIRADVACGEDLEKEFTGRNYRVIWKAFNEGDVTYYDGQDAGAAVPQNRLMPVEDDFPGYPFQIVAQ